ncbi:hypothetical protein mRhiFer1_008877 [Rhinolophus ferrumequinum]|uniref:Uncharacterized protein n=1 Tax=Rhinolophus ferrumequinum TaxID=59479 RepID=A0A7J8AEU4_RHIFE|nr:hypothetical protein mRhiFer1_008877 [Rhinolophus ferrumequinum]
MNTNRGTGVIAGASRPPVPSWARRRGREFVNEHSGACTGGGAVSGPGSQSLGGSRVAPRRGTAGQPSPSQSTPPGCRGRLPISLCGSALISGEPAPMLPEGAGQMYVLCGCSEGPPSGEGLSGRPGPLPLARAALSLRPVGLDGRRSPRRPLLSADLPTRTVTRPCLSDGEPTRVSLELCARLVCLCHSHFVTCGIRWLAGLQVRKTS